MKFGKVYSERRLLRSSCWSPTPVPIEKISWQKLNCWRNLDIQDSFNCTACARWNSQFTSWPSLWEMAHCSIFCKVPVEQHRSRRQHCSESQTRLLMACRFWKHIVSFIEISPREMSLSAITTSSKSVSFFFKLLANFIDFFLFRFIADEVYMAREDACSPIDKEATTRGNKKNILPADAREWSCLTIHTSSFTSIRPYSLGSFCSTFSIHASKNLPASCCSCSAHENLPMRSLTAFFQTIHDFLQFFWCWRHMYVDFRLQQEVVQFWQPADGLNDAIGETVIFQANRMRQSNSETRFNVEWFRSG